MQHTSFLAIVGPTAVGKSDYALAKAADLLVAGAAGIDIISVDSKQVYQGLEVLTGADVPDDFAQLGGLTAPSGYASLPPFFANSDRSIFLHGISIIGPHEEWSVAHFQQFAHQIIFAAAQAGRTVLFVGGTGLYYAQVFSADPLLRVGPDQQLRQRAEKMSTEQLQAEVQQAAPVPYAQLNNSDRHNPRRLIRVLEKAQGVPLVNASPVAQGSFEYFGLSADLETLESRIRARVEKRFAGGALAEVTKLLAHTPTPTPQALATLGVSQLHEYIVGTLSREACCALWALNEFQYAKRQLTWWKNQAVVWVKS